MTSRSHLWKVFQQTVPGTATHVQVGSYFDRFSLVIAAAASGMGAAILPTYLIESRARLKSACEPGLHTGQFRTQLLSGNTSWPDQPTRRRIPDLDPRSGKPQGQTRLNQHLQVHPFGTSRRGRDIYFKFEILDLK